MKSKKYYFKIGNITILIESNFNIKWNPFLIEFLLEETNDFDFFYRCINVDKLPQISGKLIYQNDNLEIYQNDVYETRLFYLHLYHNAYMMLEEKETENIIFISNEFLDIVTRPQSFSIMNALALEKKLMIKDAFVLHSSYIIKDDEAILFTAPSGTGKSTQAELWKKYNNAIIVNGDRTLIKKENNKWYAYGFPICGSSKVCLNKQAPIKSIVYLQQDKSNRIEKLELNLAIKKIISETSINYWNKKMINKVFNNITELCMDIPIFLYSCTKEEDAVKYLKNRLEEF